MSLSLFPTSPYNAHRQLGAEEHPIQLLPAPHQLVLQLVNSEFADNFLIMLSWFLS